MSGARRAPLALVVVVLLGLSACTAPAGSQHLRPPHRPATSHAAPSARSGRQAARSMPRALRGSSSWRLSDPARSREIEGYADPVSAAAGDPRRVMVSTSARSFRIFSYRIGGYRGGDGRLVWASGPIRGREQPAPRLTGSTHTVVAAWPTSTSVDTAGWPPGFYLLKLVASTGRQSYVPLVVRSASTSGRVALVAPTMTWEAYNDWGGYSLYHAPPGERRSWAVSFDRPNQAPGAGQFVYNVLGTVVLAERLGLPLAYEADTDVATRPALLAGATAYVSLGHDEYWTVPERRHVTAARDHGTNLVFLSSNTSYWRVRLGSMGVGRDNLVVGYKTDARDQDPLRSSDPTRTTARWRDRPHPDPENSLTGTLYECFPVDQPYRVATPTWWGFRGTGATAGTQLPHLIGEEADRVYPLPSTPRPLQILSDVSYSCGGVTTSAQSTYYTTGSGAGVIDFGTERWACAVKPHCRDVPAEDDTFVRRVMTNVLRGVARGPVGARYPARSNVADYPLPTRNQVPAS